ncbi:MAG: hypothetical protein ACI9WS_001124, partial [Paraglaciecola psychrophila]
MDTSGKLSADLLAMSVISSRRFIVEPFCRYFYAQ